MTQLDEKVEILFERMIQSWDKIKNIEDGHIEFDNGLQIYACKKSTKHDKESRENEPLRLDKNTFSHRFFGAWDLIIPDTDKMLFYINTPYRQYQNMTDMNMFEYWIFSMIVLKNSRKRRWRSI